MTLEKESEWILVDRLSDSEKQARQKSVLEEGDKYGDFGSYRSLINNGLINSMIEVHNAVGLQARDYVELLSKIIQEHLKHEPMIIADMGCGAGFIANELKIKFPESRVIGYDISQHAIEYAKTHWLKAEFHCMGIDHESNFGLKFDIIHCREFYPFTRTNNIEFALGYLNMFKKHLNPNGIIVLTLAHTEKCILNSVDSLSSNINTLLTYKKILLPSRHLYRYTRNLSIANALTHLANKIFKKHNAYCLIFQ
ncbi:MAG: class I SAM-dependent methyltransferase [Desulfobaccales bacterium]